MSESCDDEAPIRWDDEKIEQMMLKIQAFIAKNWRGGAGADSTNESTAIATSTARTVLRQIKEGEIDINDSKFDEIVLRNAMRKLDTALHYYRTKRAKEEVPFVKLGDNFNPSEIFTTSDDRLHEFEDAAFLQDDELETEFDDEQERKFVERFMAWCEMFSADLTEREKIIWFHWKMGRSVEETVAETRLTHYAVRGARRSIVAKLQIWESESLDG